MGIIDRGCRSHAILYSAAIVLRLAIFSFPSVADTLLQRVEFATPVTSYKRLTEGVYLYDSNVPPYDGGLFHQAPLLLSIFSFLTSIPNYYTIPLLYSFIDITIAHCLYRIKQTKPQPTPLSNETNATTNNNNGNTLQPHLVAALYLFNPFTVLSCVSRSSIIFSNLSIVMAILCAQRDRRAMAMGWIAFATYLGLYPAMLVPPLVLMQPSSKSLGMVTTFIASLAGLLGLSRWLVGSWDFIKATYGVILFLSDLTPNSGMFWYFFIEIFDQFRSFFMVVFQFHAFIFVAPLCIKLRHQPLFIVTVLCGIMSVFKSYPAVGDAALFLGLLPLHDELFTYFRYGFLVTNIYLYSSVLAPIFWHLWLYAGSGNANFFYAITLVYNLGSVLLLIDMIYSSLRRDFDIEHPNAIGKHVVQK
ncbi:GPI transamidase component-like protein [Zychaea mexicana]|uniref:GPI transamidase component-like protein n=1 Tax=Zychaea mexicana TaxID=64656 RepID=UPI0022FF0A30|nr:GPI transamidase component-like protein [Zychaea mexicana]KAI9491481.1 GPI transamidase component-like protein [Zychaea mexicana]